MLEIFGRVIKPTGMWITVPTLDGDRIACSVCGTTLDPVGTSDVMYPGDDDGEIIRESVEIYKTPKYCPTCKSKMYNWRFMELGD